MQAGLKFFLNAGLQHQLLQKPADTRNSRATLAGRLWLQGYMENLCVSYFCEVNLKRFTL